jgi:hypothetical protein
LADLGHAIRAGVAVRRVRVERPRDFPTDRHSARQRRAKIDPKSDALLGRIELEG